MKKLTEKFSLASLVAAFSVAGASVVVSDDLYSNILWAVAIVLVIVWRMLDKDNNGVPDFLEKSPRALTALNVGKQILPLLVRLDEARRAEGKPELTEEEVKEKLEESLK
jgi:hypothetical protein